MIRIPGWRRRIEGNTDVVFHVLNLVDGERVVVYSKANPEYRFVQNYLDVASA